LLVSFSAHSKPSNCIGKSKVTLRWDVEFVSQDGSKRTLKEGTSLHLINYPVAENTLSIIQVVVESVVAYEHRNQAGHIMACSAGVNTEAGMIRWGSNWLRGPFDCNTLD